jgi:Zn-dependent metalloprotease
MRVQRALVSAAMTLSAVACGGAAEPVAAIETRPVRHLETGLPLAGEPLEQSAVDYLRRTAGADVDLDLAAEGDLAIVAVNRGAGMRHVRLQQTHRGVPVAGAAVVVHADDTTFLGFNGYLTANLAGFEVEPAVSGDAALAAARADLAQRTAADPIEEGRALVILPGPGGRGADLAWHLELFTPATGDADGGLWSYLVAASDGRVLRAFDALPTMEQGSGPGGKSKKNKMWNHELDVEPVDGMFAMETTELVTRDRRDADQVVRGPDLGNLPVPEANDAHGYAEITLDMMYAWMDRDSVDDAGLPIVSLVHDSTVCPKNACWKDGKVHYGRSWTYFRARSGALDVVAHEIGHGFTEFHSDLEYAEQPGAMNESFSDVVGTVTEHFHEPGTADFDIAEDIWVFNNYGAERFMCDPTRSIGRVYNQWTIEDARDFEPGMKPHLASGPPNRAFCLAVGRTRAATGLDAAGAVRLMGSVWFLANAGYWTPATDYADGCRGTLDAARALGQPGDVVAAIAHSWADVGVTCDAPAPVCQQDGTCDIDGGETCASCPDDCGSCAQDCSFWKKSKCKVGIGDCSQCGDDSTCGDGVCDGDETDGNCGEDCGCEAVACGEVAPFGCFCDAACDESGDCCADQDDCDD